VKRLKPENIVEKKVEIIDKKSEYYGHWGYIRAWDGDTYHISGGSISSTFGELVPIFDRDQFVIKRKKH